MILRSQSQEDGKNTLNHLRRAAQTLLDGNLHDFVFLRRFLVKYISRDEVELSGKGNGGIVEIRNAIASYEEPSPLFGFLRYRRRNVLIKYVPEDCSRLVQGTHYLP